jgi:hypothetical protein
MSFDHMYIAGMALILSLWFVVSAIGQIPRFKAIRTYDPLSLIPNFSFFAPKPLENDYHFVFRCKYRDGEISNWVELPYCEKRRPWSPIWNPDRRQQKALIDSCSMLMRYISFLRESLARNKQKNQKRNPVLAVQTSVPYLNLLNHVSLVQDSPEAVGVQFALLSDPGPILNQRSRVIFMSSLHRLEGHAA